MTGPLDEFRDQFHAQALLAAIVASSDDAIVCKTLDGTILSWNAAAERLFGYLAAEAVGESIMLIIPLDRRDEERMILERVGAASGSSTSIRSASPKTAGNSISRSPFLPSPTTRGKSSAHRKSPATSPGRRQPRPPC